MRERELPERTPDLPPNSHRPSLRERLKAKRAAERAALKSTEEVVIFKKVPDLETQRSTPEDTPFKEKKTNPPAQRAKANPETFTSVIGEIIEIGNKYFEDNRITVSDSEKKTAIGIAAWIHHPASLKKLAHEWGENEERLKQRILSHLETKHLKNLGNEIFDRHKKNGHFEEDILTSPTAFNKFFTSIDKEARKILTEREYTIFLHAKRGVPFTKIAKKFGYKSHRSITEILSSARRKIQNELLFPKGIKKIASFHDQGLLDAANKRVVTTVKFLGEYYTTQPFANYYFSERTKRVDQQLINKGFRLLQDLLPPEEYEKARKKRTKYEPYLTRHKKRIYVSPENMEKILSLASGEQPPRKDIKVSEYPDHVTLRSSARDEKEYGRLKIAARNGKIKTIKTHYATLVLPEDIERWRNGSS